MIVDLQGDDNRMGAEWDFEVPAGQLARKHMLTYEA